MAAHLNDDVETGLTLPSEELVELPDLQPNVPPLTIQTPTVPKAPPADPTPPPALFNTDETSPGQIPELKAQFQLLSDQSSHIVDLTEVESMLIGQKGVSQESAQIVHDYYGDLFTPRVPKASFTQIPSQTNYAYVLRYAREHLKEEEPKFIDQYKGSLTDATELLQQFLEHYETNCDHIDDERDDIHRHYGKQLEALQVCPDCVVPIHAESGETVTTQHPQFVNLLDHPICRFSPNSLRLLASKGSSPFNDTAFYQAIHCIQHALRSEVLVYWILQKDTLHEEGTSILPTEAEAVPLREQGKELTLRQLLRFYHPEHTLKVPLERLHTALSETLVVWQQNQSALQSPESLPFKTVQAQYDQTQTHYVTGLDRLEWAAEVLHCMMELNQAMQQILHTLVYFLPSAK